MTREMTGAEMVIQALADQNVEHVFGYPGGAVLPIYDAIFSQNQVRHILVRHEQGAVHAAELAGQRHVLLAEDLLPGGVVLIRRGRRSLAAVTVAAS